METITSEIEPGLSQPVLSNEQLAAMGPNERNLYRALSLSSLSPDVIAYTLGVTVEDVDQFRQSITPQPADQ